jgi:arginyl-tRNA synthetase
MALRDPLLFFADQASSVISRAMDELSEETWRDLVVTGSQGTVSVLSKDARADIDLEMPPDGMGDLAFPCFQLTRFYEAPPNNVSFRLFPYIKPTDDMEPPILAGPYINLTIKPERLVEETLRSAITFGEDYGSLEPSRTRVILEHTSANPNGPLHIGRARNPIIGDTLARVMRMAGYDVSTQYYMNDMGRQIVLLYWGYKHRDERDDEVKDLKTDHRVVGYYQRAYKMAEDDPEVDAEIRSIMTRLEKGDQEMVDAVRAPALMGMEGIRASLERLGIHHDDIISESQFVMDGTVSEVMDSLASTEYTVEDDGAMALELESFGVQGRNTKFVFRRSDGTSLYTTRDLAYHLWKHKQGERLINVLGEDHKHEARTLQLALDIMGSSVKVEPIFYAFVSLPEGRMSTRTGRGVALDELMDEAVSRARKDTRERRPELDDEAVGAIGRAVGLGAVRYNIMRVQPEKSMVFRWEEALNFEGASAPFIQYSHTRACSILRKAELEGEPVIDMDPAEAARVLTHDAELALAKAIARLPGTITFCAEERKVHTLAAYAERLASIFNQFYRDVPVLQAGDLRQPRLQLIKAARTTLANTLRGLGIEAPEQM